MSNKDTISFSRAIQSILFRNNVHNSNKNTYSAGCTTSLYGCGYVIACSILFIAFFASSWHTLASFTTFYKLGVLYMVPTRAFIV